ncbi:MAG: bifunctional phosphoribosyl-AMP cyclohydrolase/phosphoribosyl-ATP diphosphatase HisIE [Cyanobacteria bacterium]|nr:bifunctional phosphoribosyl-AMP cyclohydrolase/phosphoribosyl-ATP diphosphatase HisIE [Cyanobacteria bacterium bin.51]
MGEDRSNWILQALEASFQPPRTAAGSLPGPELIGALRFNPAGLIPAIAQDWLDGAVLMLAWMNAEAIEQTLASGEVHYWSRSRQELWHKGGTSGHIQTLRGLRYDCDADVLLLSIEQRGDVACHTGARSCFFADGFSAEGSTATGISSESLNAGAQPPADACSELARVINGRRDHPQPGSYTNTLLEGGDNRILKKIGEESAEFVMACKDDDAGAIAGEAADLIFHLQVALAHHGVPWRRVQEVLAARRGAPRRSQDPS